jgi:hypothetical protein
MKSYEKIVIGGTFSSVLYSFLTGTPIIFAESVQTHPFDFYDIDVDLSLVDENPLRYALKKVDGGNVMFGTSKQEVNDKLLAFLSLSGLVPFSHLAKSIRIEDDELRISTGTGTFRVKYEELIVFDDKDVYGLPSVTENDENRITTVLDWFDVKFCVGLREYDYIETGDNFVNRIFVYSSVRPDVVAASKDLAVISYLPAQDAVQEYHYSDTYARFKILKLLKSFGIRGMKNGKNPNYPEKSAEPFKWLSPRIEFSEREIMPLPMGRYTDTEKIKFSYESPEEIILNHQLNTNSYNSKLMSMMRIK